MVPDRNALGCRRFNLLLTDRIPRQWPARINRRRTNMFKSLSTLLASLSLLAAGAVQASPAQSLSLAHAPEIGRASTAAGASNAQSETGAGIYVIGAIVAGLMIWGIVELASGDDDPDSP
ncbi:hypothetical protein DAH66_11300 [Sphingomonas koreensis]|uniref:Uncharacterized protein n=2 Tax=Sphingomonas koreensis TaxID=93064 RepID=A0A430G381_9SPHN|nr:hypothetical protein DAH66_11300 [Sphingomonas koreensis]